jgi:hypothetical protein
MQHSSKIQTQSSSFKALLSAVKKLSVEEKQLLRLELFSSDLVAEMKAFESQLKKRKLLIKRSDEEIVSITKSIRSTKNDSSPKNLH